MMSASACTSAARPNRSAFVAGVNSQLFNERIDLCNLCTAITPPQTLPAASSRIPGQRNPSTEALPHKESEFRACSRELGLHRAFSDSENIRGFANGEAVQFAQLKCSPQRR